MSGGRSSTAETLVVEDYLSRIKAHLDRLAEGHDPMGHLFAIERLARSARAERWEAGRAATTERLEP